MKNTLKGKCGLVTNLLSSLKDYGLNPREWQLFAEAPEIEEVYLQNRCDNEFRLAGKIQIDDARRASWQSLYVISL